MADVRQCPPAVYVESPPCRAARAPNKVRYMKDCEVCSTRFEATRSDAVCCSKRCSHKAWRDANKDHVREAGRATMKRLYVANPEKARARSREWHHANKEKAAEMRARWYAENHQHALDYARAYAKANGASVKSGMAAWRQANKEHLTRYASKQSAELTDHYIKKVLSMDGSLHYSAIPPEMVKAKREQLSLLRLTKQLKQEITNQLENENGN